MKFEDSRLDFLTCHLLSGTTDRYEKHAYVSHNHVQAQPTHRISEKDSSSLLRLAKRMAEYLPLRQKAPMMVGVLWMFQLIAFILVGFRLYTRLVVMHIYGIDDHFFNFAVVSTSHLYISLPMLRLLSDVVASGHCMRWPQASS